MVGSWGHHILGTPRLISFAISLATCLSKLLGDSSVVLFQAAVYSYDQRAQDQPVGPVGLMRTPQDGDDPPETYRRVCVCVY